MDTAGHINPSPSCAGTRWAPAGRTSCCWCSSRPRGCSRQQKLKVTVTRHSRVGILRIRPGGGSCHRHQHCPGRPPPGPVLPSACPPELLTLKHLLSPAPASSADGAARGAGARAGSGGANPQTPQGQAAGRELRHSPALFSQQPSSLPTLQASSSSGLNFLTCEMGPQLQPRDLNLREPEPMSSATQASWPGGRQLNR